MGRPGDFHEDRIRTAPTAQRELGYAVRELIQRTGLSSLACVAAKLEEKSQERCEALRKLANERPLSSDEEKQLKERRYFSKTALWDLVHGIRKRPPGEAQLKALYELAYGDDGTEEGWNELNGRRRALANQSTRSGSVADENHQLPTICPACGGTRPERGARAMAKPAEIRSAIASAVVPVPHQRGDRHNDKRTDLVWPPAASLIEYFAAGNLEHANGLIRHVGTQADPAETADAIGTCRDLHLSEASDTIISYAGGRPEQRASGSREAMQIAHALLGQSRVDDATALLAHAIASSESTAMS